MHAIQFRAYGDPTVLELADIKRPTPGPGEVLIRVAATAFNPVDAAIRAGLLQEVFPLQLPHTPGIDVSGTIVAVGPGHLEPPVGADVVAFLPMTADGAAAEYVLAPVDALATAPHTVPLADAAALPSAGLAAWQALFEHAGIQAGHRLLINGAGGGVGGFAVQLAAAHGVTVIATASSRSAAAVTAAGAAQVIDYTQTTIADGLDGSVDAVLNLVQTTAEENAALVARIASGGVFVSATTPGDGDPVHGVRAIRMFNRSDAGQLSHLVDLVDAGALSLDVDARYPLEALATVHTQSAAGRLRGRTLITVGD